MTNTNIERKSNPVLLSIRSKVFTTEGLLVSLILLLFIFFSITSPVFLQVNNLSNLLKQTSINGIVAVGMLFVIISAGIDLSVGAVVGLSGMTVAMMLKAGINPAVAIIASILIGTLVGLLNGILVYDGKIPAFIATLGTMTIVRGIIMLISNAQMVAGLPSWFTGMAQITVAGLPFLFVAWFVIIIVGYILSRHLVFGRNVYALGSNEESARLSGINIRFTTYGLYVFCSFVCAIAGVLMTARLGNGIPTGGQGYEMDAIAADVVGGASLMGGEGSVIGTVLGAIIIQTIRQGGNLLGVNSFILDIIVGAFLIIAVLLDKIRK